MKNPTFPALVFLTLAYCAGFVIIALVLVVARSMPTIRPTTGINAQNLAPIFDSLPSIGDVTFVTDPPVTITSKKPKATLVNLIREEAVRKVS
jgi:hypothetical protein